MNARIQSLLDLRQQGKYMYQSEEDELRLYELRAIGQRVCRRLEAVLARRAAFH